MCAFFGRGLTTYDVPLRIRAGAAVGGVPPFEVGARRAALPATRAVDAPPGFTAPARRTLALPVTSVSVVVRPPAQVAPPAALLVASWPPLEAVIQLPAVPPFIAPLRHEGALAPPRLRTDLDAARAQLVRRRLVPAARLPADEAARWLRRLADSKKMAKTRLELVGVFPDVPVTEGAPVRYDASAGALAYHLPDAPIPLSTVVIAKRTDTGVAVIGRFYR